MPLVQIDLLEGRPSEELTAIADAVHEAMVAEHGPDAPRFDRHYLDVERTDRFVLASYVELPPEAWR